MAPTIRRDLLALGLNRPAAPILEQRAASRAPRTRPPPQWSRELQRQSVAEFLRDYRRFARLAQSDDARSRPGDPSLAAVSADQLIALFLKLNVNDPAESEKTEKELRRIYGELRQQAAQGAADKTDAAEEAKEQAEAQQDPVAAIVKTLLGLLGL